MQLFRLTSTFLRRVLLADAATCVATGLLLSLGGGFLADLLALPPALLFSAGLSLFPFAAFIVYLAAHEKLSAAAFWAVVLLNALWTLDSFLILLAGWVTPNWFGTVFIAAQALGVGLFAALECLGWRNSPETAASAGQTV